MQARARCVCVVFCHVRFVLPAKVRIFFRNSRLLGGVFLGCAQESRRGRWRGVFFAWFAIRVVIGDVVHKVSTMPPLALAPGSLTRQLGCGSAIRASISSRHPGLRAGILGGLVRGIALPPRLLSSLPTPPRVPGQARNDGANAPFVLSSRLCRGCHRLPPARKCAQGLSLSALNRTFAD